MDGSRREIKVDQPAAQVAQGTTAPATPSATQRAMAGLRLLRSPAGQARPEHQGVLEASLLRASRAVLSENRCASELELETEIAERERRSSIGG